MKKRNQKEDKKSKIFSLPLKKQGQDKKSKIFSLPLKKQGQEEIVGFSLIIIIVAVILLIFIGFTITEREVEVESYEVESFMHSMLAYTTDCNDYLGKISLDSLIKKCKNNKKCLDDRDTCMVLEDIMSNMMEEAWKIGRGGILGYELNVSIEGENILSIAKGNKTGSYKGSLQPYPNDIVVMINIYD